MKVIINTEEYLYDSDIQSILNYLNISNLEYEISNVKSSNNSSFLDCVVEVIDDDGNIVSGCGIEITQTTDKDSRNSSVYQRGQKFIQFGFYYPTYKQLMYYTKPFQIKTNTAKIGMSILHCMGVELYNVIGEYPKNIDELIQLKNSLKAKGNNTPVFIKVESDKILISAKLQKSNCLSHDPNIGFVSSICFLFKNSKLPIYIINHGLTREMTKSKNKLFQNMCIIGKDLYFDFNNNSEISYEKWECSLDKYKNKDTYYTKKEDGEKVSIIKFCKYLTKLQNVEILFKNIAGCEREKIKYDSKFITVPKHIQIPDLVYLKDNKLIIIEGECDYNIKKGINQLNTFIEFKNFIKNVIKTPYEIIEGVITDKPINCVNDKYFGYFSTSKNFDLNEIIY